MFLLMGNRFGKAVVRDGFGKAGGLYCFNTSGLRVLRAARGTRPGERDGADDRAARRRATFAFGRV